MHELVEVVIPPVVGELGDEKEWYPTVEGALEDTLKKLCTSVKPKKRHPGAFWDWYVIGGRFAGSKLRKKVILDVGQEAFDRMWDKLDERGPMCSGVVAGKQSIVKPEDQEFADNLWRELSGRDEPNPYFEHSNNQYAPGLAGTLPMDICRLSEVPENHTCRRVVFATQRQKYVEDREPGGRFVAQDRIKPFFMLSAEIWNGFTFEETAWDKTFKSALELYRKQGECINQEFCPQARDDWWVISVDAHD